MYKSNYINLLGESACSPSKLRPAVEIMRPINKSLFFHDFLSSGELTDTHWAVSHSRPEFDTPLAFRHWHECNRSAATRRLITRTRKSRSALPCNLRVIYLSALFHVATSRQPATCSTCWASIQGVVRSTFASCFWKFSLSKGTWLWTLSACHVFFSHNPFEIERGITFLRRVRNSNVLCVISRKWKKTRRK